LTAESFNSEITLGGTQDFYVMSSLIHGFSCSIGVELVCKESFQLQH
jgi:hypothetical protein